MNITFYMKYLILLFFLLNCLLINAQNRYDVSSSLEFQVAHNEASAGDTIAWMPGIYSDVRQDIDKEGLIITAKPYGSVLFLGASRAVINADNTTFSGFQYVGGIIGNLDVIRVYGSDVHITQVNIQNYTSHKYLVVYEESRRTTISYCNFENRLNLDDKNILSILVDNEPGYHKIQNCSFKNFNGTGNDLGIEPIRIGVSSQGDLDSRTLVEYCYFTKCNGDGEIISHKSRQNVYRYNTFENNPVAELVLRHGDEGIVYGNFFINNMGGIRVREGSHHFIYNNYFEDLDRRSIFLQNESSDPLSDIHIYHNTIINSDEFILGSSGNNPPTSVFIANNVFANPIDNLFTQDTENETWINNISFGKIGIDVPSSGILEIDPKLSENSEGFFQPENDSPLIGAAGDGYPTIPLFEGMDYENDISLDIMQQERPSLITERAIGASEFSSTNTVQPYATELNSGPSYLFDSLVKYIAANVTQLYIGNKSDSRSILVSSNTNWTVESSDDWLSIDILSGLGDGKLILTIDENEETVNRSGEITIIGDTQSVTIKVFQDAGEINSVSESFENELLLYPNPTDGTIKASNLPQGINRSLIEVMDLNGRSFFLNEYPVNNSELLINLDNLSPGIYLLNMKFMDQSGSRFYTVKRKVIKI